MFKIKNIFAITALYYFLGISYAKVELTEKSSEYPGKELLFSDYAFKDALLVYAVCEKQVADQVRTCMIYQEVSPYEKLSRSCNVTIDVKSKESKLSDLFVGAFNPDKAIIVYVVEDTRQSQKHLHIGTIDLNKCTIGVDELAYQKEEGPSAYWQFKNQRTIVTYKTYYDAFFTTSECEGKECRLSVNTEGKLMERSRYAIDGLHFYITQFSSIDRASSDKGYVYRRFNQLDHPSKDYLYAMLKADRSEKKLTTSPKDVKYDILSTSNNKINIYFKATGQNGNMTLLQYDADGNNVLTTNLPDISSNKQVVNIYNLPNGGSILLVNEVEDATADCTKVKSFQLVKIDASGKKVGEIQMQGLDNKTLYETWTTRYRRHIWKNKQGGYCATIVSPTVKCTGTGETQENDMQIIENCFTDDDFTK